MTLDISQFIVNTIRTQCKIHHIDINVKAVKTSDIPKSIADLIAKDYGEKYVHDADYIAFFWGGIDKDLIERLFKAVDKALGTSANKLTNTDFKKLAFVKGKLNESDDEESDDEDDVKDDEDDEIEVVDDPDDEDDEDDDSDSSDDDVSDDIEMPIDEPEDDDTDGESDEPAEDDIGDDGEENEEEVDVDIEGNSPEEPKEDAEVDIEVDDEDTASQQEPVAPAPTSYFFLKITTK